MRRTRTVLLRNLNLVTASVIVEMGPTGFTLHSSLDSLPSGALGFFTPTRGLACSRLLPCPSTDRFTAPIHVNRSQRNNWRFSIKFIRCFSYPIMDVCLGGKSNRFLLTHLPCMEGAALIVKDIIFIRMRLRCDGLRNDTNTRRG